MQKTNALKITTPTDLEVIMTRTFDAPRELVWEAITNPQYIKRWMFTPQGWKWSVCEMDVRVGGTYRWEWAGPDGQMALTIHGTHREITPPSRIVHDEHMDMGPGAGGCSSEDGGGEPWELLVITELTERNGQTHLRMTIQCPSKEARDMVLASGMEHGVATGYDALDEILAEMKD